MSRSPCACAAHCGPTRSSGLCARSCSGTRYCARVSGRASTSRGRRLWLRQSGRSRAAVGPIRAGDVEIDLDKRRVTRAGEPVKLSPREYDVLTRLALGHGKVLTHKELLTAVWGPAHAHDTQYLRVFVGQLRQKLENDPASPRLLQTEPGIGYRFVDDDR